MGEYKTTSRKLAKPIETFYASNVTSPDSPLVPFGVLEQYVPTQQTESYRTQNRFAEEDPLSEEAIEEFTDVTGNGFRGEFPAAARERTQYDNGHNFYTTKTHVHFSHPHWEYTHRNAQGNKYMRYSGPLRPRTKIVSGLDPSGTGYFPSASRLSKDEIAFYGAKAINTVIPTQPGFSLATFLGELTEGLPALIGLDSLRSRGDRARSAGGEFLNLEFGWKPLVSDVRKAAEQVVKAHKILRQFERDGGRKVRRTFHFPVEVADIKTDYNVSNPNGPIHTYSSGADWQIVLHESRGGKPFGPVYLEQNSVRKIWFKGCFEYAVIEGNTFADKLAAYEQKANILLGTRLTPETLWELAPWSWLADWFTNVGDVLSNAVYLSSDGLVMRYGYLMCHTLAFNRFFTSTGGVFAGMMPYDPPVKVGPVQAVFHRETKERHRATPYGFGLNPQDFSSRQWAILGALGLTRGPKTL